MIAPCSPVLTAFATPFLTALVVFLVVFVIMCRVLFSFANVLRTWRNFSHFLDLVKFHLMRVAQFSCMNLSDFTFIWTSRFLHD
jgi:hypothetical protein